MKQASFQEAKKGFTIIELLVVIAIIGILATISVLAVSSARAKSRDAKRAGDIKQIQTALELFFNDRNRYPTTAEWNTGQILSTTTDSTSTYMQVIPLAPIPADGNCSNGQNTINYSPSDDGSTYSISFCLGNVTGSLTSGPKCLTPGGIVDTDCSPSCLVSSVGCSWQNLNMSGFYASSSITSLSVYNGAPYVSYADNGNGGKATVMKYNGSGWESVGTPGFSADLAGHHSFYISNGIPYIAFRDMASGGKLSVMKYNGSAWEYIGTQGFMDSSNGSGVYYISLFVDNGVPYLSYVDLYANSTYVIKYNGSSWENLGVFTNTSVSESSIFVYNGEPYVVYRVIATSRISVSKYDGTSWTYVGAQNFANAYYSSLFVNNGTPYIAFSDYSNGRKATVMKYNGSVWEYVGVQGFSAGGAYFESLFVYNNTLYLSYTDLINGSKATVMKYNGSAWEPVGNPGFSSGGRVNAKGNLYIYNNIPYFSYMDRDNGYLINVMKFVN